jgi:uncharacterized membrane protein YozB (DUF420 family)
MTHKQIAIIVMAFFSLVAIADMIVHLFRKNPKINGYTIAGWVVGVIFGYVVYCFYTRGFRFF